MIYAHFPVCIIAVLLWPSQTIRRSRGAQRSVFCHLPLRLCPSRRTCILSPLSLGRRRRRDLRSYLSLSTYCTVHILRCARRARSSKINTTKRRTNSRASSRREEAERERQRSPSNITTHEASAHSSLAANTRNSATR